MDKEIISKRDRKYWFEEDGLGRKWMESISPRNRFDLCVDIYHFPSKTLFGPTQVLIEQADIVLGNKEFDFLFNLEAPKGWQYIYAICDSEKGILKIGQSSKIWSRIKQHVSAFSCYGKSDTKNIQIAFSRWPVPSYLKLEDEFLSHVKGINANSESKGREFFSFGTRGDVGKCWRLAKKFLRNLPENFPNDQ